MIKAFINTYMIYVSMCSSVTPDQNVYELKYWSQSAGPRLPDLAPRLKRPLLFDFLLPFFVVSFLELAVRQQGYVLSFFSLIGGFSNGLEWL